MPTVDINVDKSLLPWQLEFWNSPYRYNVGCMGRRSGKTEFSKWRIGYVGAALGQRVAYFAPKNKLMETMWEEAKKLLAPVIQDKAEVYHRLEFKTGGIAEFWSLETEDAALGRSYHEVIVDEAAIVNSGRPWSRNISPTLSDTRGRAWFWSTPRGYNWFHSLFIRGQRDDWSDWFSKRLPTSCNPFIHPDEIEMQRRSLPERLFRQEYLAEFIGDEDAVFRYVREAATIKAQDEPTSGHTYAFGVDFARYTDFSVVAVYDITARAVVHLEISNNVEYRIQRGRIQALAERWHPIVIHIEDNAAGDVIEQLIGAGLPVVTWHTSNVSKVLLVDRLSMALEQRAIKILSDETPEGQTLIEELQAYEASRLPSGAFRYAAPESKHDDTVMAVMLAYYAAEEEYAGDAAIYRWG